MKNIPLDGIFTYSMIFINAYFHEFARFPNKQVSPSPLKEQKGEKITKNIIQRFVSNICLTFEN